MRIFVSWRSSWWKVDGEADDAARREVRRDFVKPRAGAWRLDSKYWNERRGGSG